MKWDYLVRQECLNKLQTKLLMLLVCIHYLHKNVCNVLLYFPKDTTNEDKSISKKVPYYEPRYVGDKSFLECPSVTHAKLRLRLAKSTVIKLRRKVSILQQKNRRLTKKVNTLEDLVFILKNS